MELGRKQLRCLDSLFEQTQVQIRRLWCISEALLGLIIFCTTREFNINTIQSYIEFKLVVLLTYQGLMT
jgi:hypothetical protein